MLTIVWMYHFIFVIGSCSALKCWHCIADNCDVDPDDNDKAEQKTCQRGQFCQKVYFEMHSTFYDKQFFSTVRGCAWDCIPQNDFMNCSRDLYSSRGCIQKLCCNDNDLCNKSSTNHVTDLTGIVGLCVLLSTTLTNFLKNQR